MIRESKPAKTPKQEECKKPVNKAVAVPLPSPSKVPLKVETKGKPYEAFCGFMLLVLSF
jgi:hypothetical protein